MTKDISRRDFMKAAGAAGITTGIAGCSGGNSDNTGTDKTPGSKNTADGDTPTTPNKEDNGNNQNFDEYELGLLENVPAAETFTQEFKELGFKEEEHRLAWNIVERSPEDSTHFARLVANTGNHSLSPEVGIAEDGIKYLNHYHGGDESLNFQDENGFKTFRGDLYDVGAILKVDQREGRPDRFFEGFQGEDYLQEEQLERIASEFFEDGEKMTESDNDLARAGLNIFCETGPAYEEISVGEVRAVDAIQPDGRIVVYQEGENSGVSYQISDLV